ncbi:MAG: hypothetical protein QG622_2288, partial [Actinomycetota bacterium]|nr:hypothetical protein [Actinomycetota bacterium]
METGKTRYDLDSITRHVKEPLRSPVLETGKTKTRPDVADR